MTLAGAQLENKTIEEAENLLKDEIDKYLEELEN